MSEKWEHPSVKKEMVELEGRESRRGEIRGLRENGEGEKESGEGGREEKGIGYSRPKEGI